MGCSNNKMHTKKNYPHVHFIHLCIQKTSIHSNVQITTYERITGSLNT